MPAIKPQLAKPMPDGLPADLHNYVAEPKLDGERALVEIEGGRTSAVYSRTGRSVLAERPYAWLREVIWPVDRAMLDAEAYAGDGVGIGQASAGAARSRAGKALSLAVFDLLSIDGEDLKPQPFEVRRARLEQVFAGAALPRIALTPISDDPRAMWTAWVEKLGGEGILLKHRQSIYRPGWRNPGWLKWKAEYPVDVVITGVSAKPTYTTGGYRRGEVALTYGYFDPKTGACTTVGQGIKVGPRAELEQYIGRVAEMKCWGVMPTGALRHHTFIRWRDDKPASECLAA